MTSSFPYPLSTPTLLRTSPFSSYHHHHNAHPRNSDEHQDGRHYESSLLPRSTPASLLSNVFPSLTASPLLFTGSQVRDQRRAHPSPQRRRNPPQGYVSSLSLYLTYQLIMNKHLQSQCAVSVVRIHATFHGDPKELTSDFCRHGCSYSRG